MSVGAGATATRTFDVPVGQDFPFGSYLGSVAVLVKGDTLATASFRLIVVFATAAEPTEPVPVVTVAPNPSRGRAELRFALTRPAPVRLALYDVLGREVAAVDAGPLEAGTHRLPLDLGELPAGVYVWRLSAGERIEAGRLTVTR